MPKLSLDRQIYYLQSSAEREIAFLKEQLQEKTLKRNSLRKQALYYLANIGAEEKYKRILGNNSDVLSYGDGSKYKKISQYAAVNEVILGSEFDVKSWKIEKQNEDNFLIVWRIAGQVGDIRYALEVTSNPQATLKRFRKSAVVRKLTFEPSSQLLQVIAENLKENDFVKMLIPSLYLIQLMIRERSEVETILESYEEVILRSSNDGVLFIYLQVSFSHQIEIEWGFTYDMEIPKYLHNVSVDAPEDVTIQFSKHRNYDALIGEKILNHPDDILDFIHSFIKTSKS